MNVLHFYKTSYPESMGGVEQAIRQLTKACEGYGVKSTILSLSKKHRQYQVIIVDGQTVHKFPVSFEVASTPFSYKIISLFKQLTDQADLLHYHFPYPFTDFLHLMTRPKAPALVTYHSDIVRQKKLGMLYEPIGRCFLESVDAVVATSPNYLKTSKTLLNLKDKVEVIPIGLDENDYLIEEASMTALWKAKVGEGFFLFLGVLRYYKGLYTLLEAAQYSKFQVVIVGAGPERENLEKYAKKLNVTNVTFLGFVTEADKSALLTLCKAVVFPSHLRSEAFGVSLVEGAMFGKPLISCEIGTGTSYVNLDGKTGVVIPPKDHIALRKAMQTLSTDKEMCEKLGLNARSRYLGKFTAQVMAEEYLKLYKQLTS